MLLAPVFDCKLITARVIKHSVTHALIYLIYVAHFNKTLLPEHIGVEASG
jgi:hypothetical protein